MHVRWTPSRIPGLLEGESLHFEDTRGSFTKAWTGNDRTESGSWDEVFYSTSRLGVIRGFHVQASADAGSRLIFVTAGEAMDFVLDLRRGSPTFGDVECRLLTPGTSSRLVPRGCAHAFEALSDATTMVYLQEGLHDPSCDIGVLWSSVGIETTNPTPVVSARDVALPPLSEFDTPFTWSGRL